MLEIVMLVSIYIVWIGLRNVMVSNVRKQIDKADDDTYQRLFPESWRD